jgi:uncharacterized protein
VAVIKFTRTLGFALAALVLGCAKPNDAAPASARARAEIETLFVDTAAGPVRISVEIADDEAERNRGLMFRETLADGSGMLFDFPEPEHASFWMRNTPLSLDIIFIGTDGRILNIAEYTTPYSDEPVSAVGLTRGVLELRGGQARALGIRAGDRVRHRIFP